MADNRLYKSLNSAGYYTKSEEEFNKQFGTPEGQKKLYGALNSAGHYTKTEAEFINQFFSEQPVQQPLEQTTDYGPFDPAIVAKHPQAKQNFERWQQEQTQEEPVKTPFKGLASTPGQELLSETPKKPDEQFFTQPYLSFEKDKHPYDLPLKDLPKSQFDLDYMNTRQDILKGQTQEEQAKTISENIPTQTTQKTWEEIHPKLNKLFSLPGGGITRGAYTGARKMIGGVGSTIDFIASNIANNITGGMTVDENGNITAPWEDDYSKDKSEFYNSVREFENNVPISKGGAQEFIGQMIPQTAGLVAVVMSRNPSLSKAYLAQMYASSFGMGIETYDDYIKETGQKTNDTDRYLVGLGYGTAEYIGEKIGLDYFMPKGYGKVVARALNSSPGTAKEIGQNVLENYAKTTKQSFPGLLKKIAIGSQVEGGQEDITELMQAAIDKWLIGKDVTGAELRDRLIQSHAGGTLMGASIAPFAHISQNIATTNRRRNQGTVTISIDENGLPLEILTLEDKTIGIRPDGEEITNISKETLDKSITYETAQFEEAISTFREKEPVPVDPAQDASTTKFERNIEIDKNISGVKDDDGNVTKVILEGKEWYVKNSQDLGKPGATIFVRDAEGNTKPINSKKITQWTRQTPEEVKTDIQNEDAFLEAEKQRHEAEIQKAADKGIVVGAEIENEFGTGTVTDISKDGVITAQDEEGKISTSTLDETAPVVENAVFTEEEANVTLSDLNNRKSTVEEKFKFLERLPAGTIIQSDPDSRIVLSGKKTSSRGTESFELIPQVLNEETGEWEDNPSALQIISRKNGEYNVNGDFTTDFRKSPYTDTKTGERKIFEPKITLPNNKSVNLDELSSEDAFLELSKTDPKKALLVLRDDIDESKNAIAELNKAKKGKGREERAAILESIFKIQSEIDYLENKYFPKEEKLTESVKKNSEPEKKLTEIKSEKSVNEPTKKIVEAESSQKVEPVAESGEQKLQTLEVKKADIERRRQEDLETTKNIGEDKLKEGRENTKKIVESLKQRYPATSVQGIIIRILEKLIDFSKYSTIIDSEYLKGRNASGQATWYGMIISQETLDGILAGKEHEVHTFIHEFIHGFTTSKISDYNIEKQGLIPGFKSKLTAKEKNAIEQLQRIFEKVKKDNPKSKEYGFTNLDEFIAEAFSNSSFQYTLKNTKAEGKKSNLFSEFINAIGDLLFEQLERWAKRFNKEIPQRDTITGILEDVLAWTEDLIDQNNKLAYIATNEEINAKYDAELSKLEETTSETKIEAKKADIERRRQELESSREIETLYDLTTPIAEDSKEIVAKIDKANELKKEAAVISEQAAKETNEERKIALNSDANSLYEKVIILDKEVKTSRDSVINNTPIKQAINSAKILGQKLLNKIKLAAKSNEWVSSMVISKEEFTKLEDATKRLSVKDMGEVTSNSEVIPDILLIEEINAKYDAELAALNKEQAEQSVNTNPTEAQKEAGNYKKGHVNIAGFDITIENPKGSERTGTDKSGKKWSVTLNNTYGYFKRSKGKDGDQIDVFLGENLNPEKVFVIDQNNEKGEFDESKVMLGFDSLEQAKEAYLSNYSPGWKGLGQITEVGIADFKTWLNDGQRQNKPFGDYKNTPEPVKEQAKNVEKGQPLNSTWEERQALREKAKKNLVTDDLFNALPKKIQNSLQNRTSDFFYKGESWKNVIEKSAVNPDMWVNTKDTQQIPESGAIFDSKTITDYYLVGADNQRNYSRKIPKEYYDYFNQIKERYNQLIDNNGEPVSEEPYQQPPLKEEPKEPAKDVLTKEEKVKEPWEMTREEFSSNPEMIAQHGFSKFSDKKMLTEEIMPANHKKYIKQAKERGEKIPDNIKAEYPELFEEKPNLIEQNLGKRNIWIPNMTKSKLDKLLNKENLTLDDIEDLKDFEYFLLTDQQSAVEKGFYKELLVSQKEKAYVLKDKFLLTNIKNKINSFEEKPVSEDKKDENDNTIMFNMVEDDILPETVIVNGKERPTTNSSGRPIHPTIEGIKNFYEWFGNSKAVDEQGRPLVVYSGHANTAMFGNKFTHKKAISGGFYVSESPDIASGYAVGKIGNNDWYENGDQYRLADKKGNFTKKIWQVELTEEQKQKIDELSEQVDENEEAKFGIHHMKQWAKNNYRYDPLARRISADPYNLYNIWQFNEMMGHNIAYNKEKSYPEQPEFELQQKNETELIFDELGIKWNSFQWSSPGVFPLYIRSEKPIDADKPFPADVLAELEKAAKKERTQPESMYDNDKMWTKDYPLKRFVEDIKNGDEYWTTQVPKKALEIFRQFGYDGYKERGQKGSEAPREERGINWVAFDAWQLKSAIANKGTFDAENDDLLFRIIGETGAANLDKAEEATTRLDNLRVAKEMESPKEASTAEEFDDAALNLATLDLEDDQVRYPKTTGRKSTNIISGSNYDLNILDREEIPIAGPFEMMIEDNDGETIGFIRATTSNKIISINLIHIKEESRGHGIGTDIYENLLNEGYTIKSDKEITDATYSLYDRLAKSGYQRLVYPDGRIGLRKQFTPQQIKLATGWERGADGKWRYEVPDFQQKTLDERIKNAEKLSKGKTVDLVNFIEDKELFSAYPKLRWIQIKFDKTSNSQGSYNKLKGDGGFGQIIINPDKHTNDKEIQSTLLHEIQHAIQEIEGFARGGNTEQFEDYSDVAAWWNDEGGANEETPFDELTKAEKKAAIERYKDEIGDYDTFDKYKSLAGEVESRNVQTRMNYTPEQRRQTLLEETEDVSREDQIFIYDGLGASNLEPEVKADPFYSPTERALERIQQNKGTAEQFKAMLLKNGAKQAEMDWMGWDERFPDSKKTITKAEVQDWIDGNKVEVEEVQKGTFNPRAVNRNDVKSVRFKQFGSGSYVVSWNDSEIGDIEISTSEAIDEDEAINAAIERANYDNTEYRLAKPKYSQYQLPGGENYREVLLTMPEKRPVPTSEELEAQSQSDYKKPYSELSDLLKKEVSKQVMANKGYTKDYSPKTFKSSHFEEPNILAHIRFNERTDSEGNKVLFIEEWQADKGQEWLKLKNLIASGKATQADIDRFNFLDKNFPFNKTDEWLKLAMRRMIRYAAENGFARIAWTTGEQQSERYDLSKQVDSVESYKNSDGTYHISIIKDKSVIDEKNLNEYELEGYLGKNLSEKIINETPEKYPNSKIFKGLDLKVGGEGMKAFYDAIVPNAAKEIGKKFGAKVEPIDINNGGKIDMKSGVLDLNEAIMVQSLPITPAMQETALREGFPMFKIDAKLDISDKANPDIKDKKNTLNALNALVKQFGVPITVIHSSELSEVVGMAAKRKKGTPVAFYHNGTAYIISDKIQSVSDVKQSYLHEAILHKGLDLLFEAGPVTVLGKKYNTKNELLDEVYSRLDQKLIDEIAEKYTGGETSTPKQQRIIAEEVLAKLNELEIIPSRLEVFMDSLWKFIKKLVGFSSKQFTRTELHRMLADHRKMVQKAARGGISESSDPKLNGAVDFFSNPMFRFRSSNPELNKVLDNLDEYKKTGVWVPLAPQKPTATPPDPPVKKAETSQSNGKIVDKTVVTERTYKGDIPEAIRKRLEEIGLTRERQNQKVAEQIGLDIIEEIGLDRAIEAVRNYEVKGAPAAAIYHKLLQSIDAKMNRETDPERYDKLAKEYADIVEEMGLTATIAGQYNAFFNYIYQTSDLGFNAEKMIKDYKKVNNGEISTELEEKFKQLEKEFKEVMIKLSEAEERAKELEEQAAVDAIKASIERQNKRKAKASEKIREKTDKLIELIDAGKINRPGIFMAASPASLAWDLAMDTVKTAVKATGRTIEAIAKGWEAIKSTDWYKNLDANKQKQAKNAYFDYFTAKQDDKEQDEPKEKDAYVLTKNGIRIPHDVIRGLVEQGIDNINDLTQAVYDIIVEDFPEITIREVRDAITGYGNTMEQNQEQIEKEIRKMKFFGRVLSGLEDVEQGERPKKSGLQRDKPDPEQRAANKQLREAMKLLPVDEERKLNQQKTQLDAAKQRLINQIEDLQREIDKGELTPKNARTMQEDDELQRLKALRDAKKKEHAEKFNDEDFLNKKRVELTKKAVSRRIAELEKRISEGDFAPKQRKELIADNELIRLRAEKLRIMEEYEHEKYLAKLKNRTQAEKIKDGVWDAWNLGRALNATFDFSFVGVQGLTQTLAHPIYAKMAFKNAFRFFASQSKTDKWIQEIKSQEWYPLLKESKLSITEPGGEITAREELFYSGWTDWMWNKLGELLKRNPKTWINYSPTKAFERASLGYLDTLRVLRFLDGIEMLKDKGIEFNQSNKDAYKQMTDVINTLTGRASIGKLDPELMSKIFYSPRNWASQFKTATPYAFYHFGKKRAGAEAWKPSVAQKMAMADFSKAVGITTAFVALAALLMNGDDDDDNKVELNPISSDFGKIIIGGIRIDPWGGRIQQVVLTARFITGDIKNAYGEIVPIGTPYKSATYMELLYRAATNKLAPTPRIIFEHLSTQWNAEGEKVDAFGNPYTLYGNIVEKMHPMYANTVYELFNDDPSALDGLLSFWAFWGGNVQTNGDLTPEKITDRELRIQTVKKAEYNAKIDAGSELTEQEKANYQTAIVASRIRQQYTTLLTRATIREKDGNEKAAENLRKAVEESKIMLNEAQYDYDVMLKEKNRLAKIIKPE